MTSPRLSILSVTSFALCHVLPALAQQTQQQAAPQQAPWGWPGPWHMWHGGWGFWWLFPVFMLFMVVVCLVVFPLARAWSRHRWGPWHTMDRPSGPRVSGDPTYSALEILNERFAKGEIDTKEYLEKKATLTSIGDDAAGARAR